jgi:hypothetical protein
MKYLLIFFILIFSQSVSGQKLKGSYHRGGFEDTDYTENWSFKKDGTFRYFSQDAVSTPHIGRGTYKIRFSVLFLNFDSASDYNDELENLELQSHKCEEDSITIEICVKEKSSGNVLLGCNAHFPNIGSQRGHDSKGILILKLPKSEETQTLIISYLDFEDISIPLKMYENHKIQANLVMNAYNIVDGGKEKYFIVRKTRKTLVLRKNSRFEKFIIYGHK